MSGTTNWSNVESWQRVDASILATGVKVDLKEAAKYFGCTYDTLENRFRKLKKDAVVLKAEIENGERGGVIAPSRTTKSNPTTPHKPKTPKKDALSSVANGRVSKASPTKKKPIKQEHTDPAFPFDDHLMDLFPAGEGENIFDGMDDFS